MNLRVKFALIGVLLLMSLSGTFFAAHATLGAVHSLQVQQKFARVDDVRAIQPWMTVPFISHIYHVPPDYLYATLDVKPQKKPPAYTTLHTTFQNTTLHTIALSTKHPDAEIINKVQQAIKRYQHSDHFPVYPAPGPNKKYQPGRIAV
ncbi:MAG TPA: hypothetical protein VHZ51_02755 [Ktedonobacteraceae bacterium]|nr:hypothetical protein [Ktedonobacteraceae bacterium]